MTENEYNKKFKNAKSQSEINAVTNKNIEK